MGVCLVAGILISAKGGCLSGPSEWKKEEVKKDGLDVYKYVDISTFHSKIKRGAQYVIVMPEKVRTELEAAIDKSPSKINDLESWYNGLIKNRKYIDIFRYF